MADSGQRSNEPDADEMEMAIQALSSMKASSVNGDLEERRRRLPPTGLVASHGEVLHGQQDSYSEPWHASSRANGAGALQYSYVLANGGRSERHHLGDYAGGRDPASSASTSAYTHSSTNTPSIRTTTSSVSSPGTPDAYERSPYFGQGDEIGLDERSRELATATGQSRQALEDGFIGRVSQFPLVSGALRVYERGRNSSRVVKYSTDLVESSVKTISRPVINRVVGPEFVDQIDGFACRQLDWFGSKPNGRAASRSPSLAHGGTLQNQGEVPNAPLRDPTQRLAMHDLDDPEDSLTVRSGSTPTQDGPRQAVEGAPGEHRIVPSPQNQVTRSRWQNLVIEAGVTAGGIGAAVSEESMKSLKYCLHWLHYATAHLDHQVGILREFIVSLSAHSQNGALVRSEDARAASILEGIKRDVVETIRKVVDVVSTYAGAALPEHARRYVRSSILGLPAKWIQANQDSRQTTESSRGPSTSEAASGAGMPTPREQQPLGPTQQAAERTLTFAVESLDMLRGLLGIFNDSVDRADAWVERLRLVGLQRQHVHQKESLLPSAPSGVDQEEVIQAGAASAGVNGIRKRDDEIEQPVRRRKNMRTLSVDACSIRDESMELDV